MAQKYFVAHNGQQEGPYDLQQIIGKVKDQKLFALDYIYDDQAGDWVLLAEYEALKEHLSAMKPSAPPKPGAAPAVEEMEAQSGEPSSNSGSMEKQMTSEWFILKGDNKFGPFTYVDVVKMLQQKLVFEFDVVWKAGMESWQRVAEIDDFNSNSIEKMQKTLMPEIEEVFFRRKHRRVKYGGTILVHDNQTVWKGQGVEISAGGAGVIMENAMVVPGQRLYLHFKPGDGVPPFNAVCEVVSKRYVDGVKDRSAPIRYGLKFTNISDETKKFLDDFTATAEAA